MKDLVVGAAAHLSWNDIEPWVVSLERSGYTGQKAMIAYNLASNAMDQLTRRGFYIKHAVRQDRAIHVDRFFYMWQLLFELEARYVIATDTRDLIFQTNPSAWLEEHLPPFRLNVGSECLAYKDEEWGSKNMLATFGPSVHRWIKDETIYNAGSFAGETRLVRDFCLNIYLVSCQNRVNNPDQAALNVLVNLSPWKEITRYSRMEDGWACQAGTVADPSKISTLSAFLREPEPVLNARGLVCPAGSAQPFCLVHQYDRNPDWNMAIRKKYHE